MSDRHTTIWVSESTHKQLKQNKPDVLTYDEFLSALVDEVSETTCQINVETTEH